MPVNPFVSRRLLVFRRSALTRDATGWQLSPEQVAEICDKAKVQLIVSGGRVAPIGPAVKALRPHITVHELTQSESLAFRTNAHATGALNGAADGNVDHAEFEKVKDDLASISVPDPAYLLHSTCVFFLYPRPQRFYMLTVRRLVGPLRHPRLSRGRIRAFYHVSLG
jgi:hypothetical protein